MADPLSVAALLEVTRSAYPQNAGTDTSTVARMTMLVRPRVNAAAEPPLPDWAPTVLSAIVRYGAQVSATSSTVMPALMA
jgi:hypothetical protein